MVYIYRHRKKPSGLTVPFPRVVSNARTRQTRVMTTQPIVFLSLQTFEGSSNTYRQKLLEMRRWPQCRWLFEELFSKNCSPDSITSVSFIDNHDGNRLEESNNIELMLKSASLRITTRIVVLVHKGPDNVDRDILDKICSAFDIDPLFVMSHFYWHLLEYSRSVTQKIDL